MYMMDNSKREK